MLWRARKSLVKDLEPSSRAAAWLGPKTRDCHWQRYLFRAWRRGRRASPLVLARYEELLPLPLDEVRQRLGIAPPQAAHPGGIVVFDDEAPATP